MLFGCQQAADELPASVVQRPAFRIQPIDYGIQMPPGAGLASDASDELFWIGYDTPSSPTVHGIWNQVAERFEPFPVPPGVALVAASSWEHGWYLLSKDEERRPVIVHVARQRSGRPGAVVTKPLAKFRSSARLLALADGSALVVGGLLEGDVRTRSVELVRLRGGELSVASAADLPGPAKGVALVALSDGRAMALGGTDEAYLDCQSCTDATRIYDPASNVWTAGSNLRQPRTNASATLLPDGSVLVAGGWSKGFGWQTTASPATERWDPKRQIFEAAAPMPVGVAGHEAAWATGMGKRILLLSGGWYKAWQGAKAMIAYDVASGTWHTAGEHCPANDRAGWAVTGSINVRGHLLQWCMGEGTINNTASPLRWPLPALVDAQNGFDPVRGATAFLPAGSGRPALVIGGLYEGGVPTAAVDAVTADGHVNPLVPLNIPRFAAVPFSLKAGVVVAGGKAFSRGGPDESAVRLPMEWMPADPGSASWKTTQLQFGTDDVLARAGDAALLALRADGSLDRIVITAKGADLAISRVPLPPPPRTHVAQGDHRRIALRQLDDGRIIIAGGMQQDDTLALFGPQALRESAPDQYVPDGPLTPWTDYDVFDPASGRWLRSAPASASGGVPLILDDGRVLRLTFDKLTRPQAEDGSWPVTEAGVLEISSKDGGQWSSFPSPAPLVRLDEATRVFELDGVLFLSGQDPRLRTGSPRRLLAFDASSGAWKTMWEARPGTNWRALQGRVVLVKLPGGRRAPVPVEGL